MKSSTNVPRPLGRPVVRQEERFHLISPQQTWLATQGPDAVATTSWCARLQTRTPPELKCCQANGALFFINPLFIKVHHPDNDHSGNPNSSGTADQSLREKLLSRTSSLETNTQHSPSKTPQACVSNLCDNRLLVQSNLRGLARDTKQQDDNTQDRRSQRQSGADSVSQSPPTYSTPLCSAPRQSTLPLQQHNMPEKIPWISIPKENVEERERGSGLLSHRGSSPLLPKRLGTSSPISIPRPSLPIPLSRLSYCPRLAKSSLSSSQEDAQCHLALEDQTIEEALRRARLSQRNSTMTGAQHSGGSPDSSLMTSSKQEQVQGGVEEEAGENGRETSQRLSDMSLSTDSSDSLDLSQSSAFFLPPLHDPSPPTEADFDTHLPLSILSSFLPYTSMEDDNDDEDDKEDEETDYGTSQEGEQDHDLTIVPPGHNTRRRSSAGALVLQKALRGQLRKMSGVFNSLLTPEKRVIRRVLELSRDKGSYFGSLVQDYLSYMGEGAGAQAWQGYASGLELLQTLRQFITQMKSYLQQSSELDLPIESLIPEDQIDPVLEKAVHKCVLKPLKPVVSTALLEFQVRSGAWQELKQNLSTAKARQPQDMGIADTPPPDPLAIEKIRNKFHTLCKLYSPEKKVAMLLRICKLIYSIMEDNSGRLYGADDFLPMLTYILAQCNMPQLDNEILYMMELLDPSLLQGEGGYYLTSAYGAMSLIRNFHEEQAARVLSAETRDTLHQWHRRRTSQRSAPSIDDFQNYLRVALQELDNGCTAKTLQVRPYATVEEVCQLCAHKFKVLDPENYSLFLITEGSSQQLAADTCPQKIKAELHSRAQAAPFHFVFRRVTSPSAPLDSSPSFNECAVISDPQVNLNVLSMDLSVPSPQSALSLGLSPTLSLSLPPSHFNGNSISI